MNLTTCIKGLLPAAALCLTAAAQAGNVPQYAFADQREGFSFEFLGEDANQVKCTYGEGDEMVFPDRQTLLAYSGQGFPIGFDFHYAGRTFNQFAIDNNGYILLGKDRIEFLGYCNMFFNEASRYATNSFYMGMNPAMFGIKSGEISYKVSGQEGDRKLTVEFAHLNVNEPSTRGNAIYSLQIVLCEKDDRVLINFLEEESPYVSFMLVCGLQGWSNEDNMLITSRGLGEKATVSPEHFATMQTPDATIRWDVNDILGETHTDPYQFSFSFTPTGAPDFTCKAPADLTVEQEGDVAIVSCTRPEDAPATVILFSEKPILEFPEQGLTYPVKNDKDEYVTTFGDATMIYYSNTENPTAEFPGLKSSTRYYVKAFGVNGYPYYSVDTSSDLEFISSHPAPYVMQATTDGTSIAIKTIGDDPIIIATTLDRVNVSKLGISGIFGLPDAGMKVGDEIEGGGTVIYVGDPGDFTYTDAVPNRQNFFRAWAVHEGRISKTYINASGVTVPVMPYKPELELYTLYETPLNWITQTTSTETTVTTIFTPRFRGANEDEPALEGVSASGTTSALMSPEINYGSDGKLSFEWAMETVREINQGDAMVVLPEGNEPGKFGLGHSFKVTCGRRGTENTLFTATEYTGKMITSPNDPDKYISGTSEFLPVEVDLPTDLESARITFSFSTEGFSYMYLRNIVVTGSAGVETVFGPESSDIISGGEGALTILSAKGGDYTVYSLEGHIASTLTIPAAEGRAISLPAGIYIVSGHKVIVK